MKDMAADLVVAGDAVIGSFPAQVPSTLCISPEEDFPRCICMQDDLDDPVSDWIEHEIESQAEVVVEIGIWGIRPAALLGVYRQTVLKGFIVSYLSFREEGRRGRYIFFPVGPGWSA